MALWIIMIVKEWTVVLLCQTSKVKTISTVGSGSVTNVMIYILIILLILQCSRLAFSLSEQMFSFRKELEQAIGLN